MGKDLYESSLQARELMERANEILGFCITDIMFEGADEDLRATRVTQPAIFRGAPPVHSQDADHKFRGALAGKFAKICKITSQNDPDKSQK